MKNPRAALRKKMVAEGWSLKDVAKRAVPEVTYEALRGWLGGRRVGWKVAAAVASVVGCEPADVIEPPRY